MLLDKRKCIDVLNFAGKGIEQPLKNKVHISKNTRYCLHVDHVDLIVLTSFCHLNGNALIDSTGAAALVREELG